MIQNLGLTIIGGLGSGCLQCRGVLQPIQLADRQYFARMDPDINTQSLVRNRGSVDGALFYWFILYLQGK